MTKSKLVTDFVTHCQGCDVSSHVSGPTKQECNGTIESAEKRAMRNRHVMLYGLNFLLTIIKRARARL